MSLKKLWIKLKTPWSGEEENKQKKNTRLAFLKTFLCILETNPDGDFNAFYFFTITQLNYIRILMGPQFNKFTTWFTRENYLRHKQQIDYFLIKIQRHARHVKLPTMLKKQLPTQLKIIVAKLKRIKKIKKRPGKYTLLKEYLKITGIGRYWHEMDRIGKYFTNRQEVDESNWYCLQLVNETS